MTLGTAFLTFFTAWWVALIMVSSLGLQTNHQPGKEEYAGAPLTFDLKRKIWQATILAVCITGLLALMINYEVVPLRDVYRLED